VARDPIDDPASGPRPGAARDPVRLTTRVHDLIVVGGGIHGAFIAWDATLRGLRVALIEQGDLGAATSANSLRIVHGGLRYLSRGDFTRMRESIDERSALLRIAPSLVEPMPVLVPTQGLGTQSPMALGAALVLNDLLSIGRNRELPPERHIPRGRLVSAAECIRLMPAFPGAGGGALWYDARLRDPEGLVRAIASAAERHGAEVAERVRVDGLLSHGGTVGGVEATDLATGSALEVRGRTVAVAAGPWTPVLTGTAAHRPQAFALNLVLARRWTTAAIGLRATSGPAEDPVIGGHRFIFLVPQEETTLLGTWYAPGGNGDPAPLIARGSAALLSEGRAACPGLGLTGEDVIGHQWGWLPLKHGRESGRPSALAERPQIVAHGAQGGLRGMFSVEGTKYTTARRVAQRTVDLILSELGLPAEPCRTAQVRVDDVKVPPPPGARLRRDRPTSIVEPTA
jgi:glycerol-3-phosphate dehydrogenase